MEILEENLIAANLDQRCKESQFKILETGSLSNFDIQHFSPQSPGYHPVYMIANGALFRSMSHYIKLVISPRIVIGKTLRGDIVKDSLFTKVNNSDLMFGPNGLCIHKNKLLTIDSPLLDLKELLDIDAELNAHMV